MLPVFANRIVGGEISRLYYMIIAVDFNSTILENKYSYLRKEIIRINR